MNFGDIFSKMRRKQADPSEAPTHWVKCQEILREDCPWIFAHYAKSFSLVRPRVGNYVPGSFPYGQEKQLRLEGGLK